MQLVADRFVVQREGAAVDLATGLRVCLRVVPSDPATDVRWSAQCDALARLHHRAIAPLVDYGPLGRSDRFEAWQCGPLWDGAARAAREIRESVATFLAATGLAAPEPGAAVHGRFGAPVIMPSIALALEPPVSAGADAMPLEQRGLRIADAGPLAALAEMFHALDGPRLHAVAAWGPRGAGKRWLVAQLARLARISGFIPVATPMLAGAARDLWRGRSLFIIDVGGSVGGSEAWSAILDAAIASPVPHVLLIVGEKEVAGIDGAPLRPTPAEQLIDAVCPRALTPALERDVRRAAERSDGWPARFAAFLWPAFAAAEDDGRSARKPTLIQVAEEQVVYGGDERLAIQGQPTTPATWPAPGELASLRRRVADASRLLARGRHTAAVRALRQAVAAFARRDSWIDAADAGLQLARVLLQRGQARDAETAIDAAREYGARGGQSAQLADAAILAGGMWIDRVRLDEAETVLTAAVTSSVSLDDRERTAQASLTMARCLFWRGRYDEAFAVADRVEETADDVRIRRRRRLATIAIARGDTSSALRLVGELQALSSELTNETRAAVAQTAAFVHLAAGDATAAAAHAQASIRAARRARDPLRAVRARIILAEAERRRGAGTAAAAQMHRLTRVERRIPPLLQAQLRPQDNIRVLPPLSLLIAAEPVARSGLPIVDQVIAIVRACQTAEDELVVLRDVCARVRQQLLAASVAFVVGRPDALGVLVGDGFRPDIEVARRAVDAGVVIPPHRHEERVVAAAPVQYAGGTIAALSVRWTLGSIGEQSYAAAVLATTAVAAAPIVSAAIVRRDRMVDAPGRNLLGTTLAMEQVRRLIERAASAPFPVLIEGESGSGKELVAQAIHRGGARRDRPFRTLNCAAIPDDLAEAELFGHVRGSFTGAVGDRTGVFEEAHGGTLFLDEVGELSPRAQAKLLRVLQEGELRRVGENVSRRVDVRIVAATNRDLRGECDAGRFRLDLLYRLDVIRIALPPLRERAEDVPMLVERFWCDAATRINSRATLSAATIAALTRYHWPGNVRELQNVLAALAVRCSKRGVVPPSALPPAFAVPQGSPAWRLDDARRTFEERFVRAALARTGGHRGRAAAELGVSRQGLTKLMSRLGIS